jgi:hypothetical protein
VLGIVGRGRVQLQVELAECQQLFDVVVDARFAKACHDRVEGCRPGRLPDEGPDVPHACWRRPAGRIDCSKGRAGAGEDDDVCGIQHVEQDAANLARGSGSGLPAFFVDDFVRC